MNKIQNTVNIKNKRARFEYEILDTFVAGIQLGGTEIKSIRLGKASIMEAFCVVENNEVFIRNMFINEYSNASFYQHKPKADRKLLLNRQEINKLAKKVETKGFTIVPLRIFINEKGLAKLEIALAQGKNIHDKRQTLKEKDDKRTLDRVMKNYK
ncbi:SsrA-binding protein [Lishizhenia tianjinensis]|uniref:SsrA-binding protein n=1 Tax=Lishizhenia tianjinensis TaxID=477690 RepID=A0A1I7AF92_9FLAO|nr:SsrA-binding protein SmpB [Lishizhenia tianjinensis]SFT73584.1 SsrA-binding protein [Lishizhenia tianjinensis]